MKEYDACGKCSLIGLLFLLLLYCCPSGAFAASPQILTFQHSNTAREYILYRPDHLPVNAPLVFMLHGLNMTDSLMMALSGMNRFADANRFAVVYPQALFYPEKAKVKWDAKDSSMDISFLSELAQFLQEQYQLDPQKTFVCGYSNGAKMTYSLACEASDTFKAIAVFAGRMASNWPSTPDKCNPSQPVPVLHIHGTDDTDVLYSPPGGEDGAESIVSFWAGLNSATTTDTSAIPPITTAFYYGNGIHGNEVWLYKMHGWTHEWPGKNSVSGIDAAEVMADFFSLYMNATADPTLDDVVSCLKALVGYADAGTDANLDGKIDMADPVLILQKLSGLR